MEDRKHVNEKETGKTNVIGKSVKRVDAFEKVTGRAKYAEDLCDRNACGEGASFNDRPWIREVHRYI